MRRALLGALLLAAVCLPVNACTDASATARTEIVFLAPGDSLQIAFFGTWTGKADSIRVTVNDSGPAPRWAPDTVRIMAPVPAKIATAWIKKAVPPYPEGSGGAVRTTMQGWYTPPGSTIKPSPVLVNFTHFTVPSSPVGGGTIDSVKVIPSSFQGFPGDTAKFTVLTYYKGGSSVGVQRERVLGIKPGVKHIMFTGEKCPGIDQAAPGTGEAYLQQHCPGYHADTASVTTLAGGVNEPAGWPMFASLSGTQLPAVTPGGTMPGETGSWRRFPVPDPDLTLVADPEVMGKMLP